MKKAGKRNEFNRKKKHGKIPHIRERVFFFQALRHLFTALFLPATCSRKRFGTDDKLQCFLGHIAKISVSSKRLVNNHNETCKLAFLVSRFDQYDLDIRADGAKES